jgi:hypothetical protein
VTRFPTFTSVRELQAAKRAAAERFTAIAMSCVPDGYTMEYCKSLYSAKHWGHRKLIKTPRPVTRKSLYIFLHECAHAQLGHSHNGRVPVMSRRWKPSSGRAPRCASTVSRCRAP